MLKIRLQRVGRKNEPSFRFVVTDSQNSTKSGKYLEVLGHFDYRRSVNEHLDAERVKHWIAQGAKPTDSVHNYLVEKKIIAGKKINVLPRKSPPKKEEEAKKDAAPAPTSAPAVAEPTPTEAAPETAVPAEQAA